MSLQYTIMSTGSLWWHTASQYNRSSRKAWITSLIYYLDRQTHWNQGGPETPGKSSDILLKTSMTWNVKRKTEMSDSMYERLNMLPWRENEVKWVSSYLLIILIFNNAHWILWTLQPKQEAFRDLIWNINEVVLKLQLTSMIAAWTLGFWNAIATSGLAIIFEMTSCGESPIWSDENDNIKC